MGSMCGSTARSAWRRADVRTTLNGNASMARRYGEAHRARGAVISRADAAHAGKLLRVGAVNFTAQIAAINARTQMAAAAGPDQARVIEPVSVLPHAGKDGVREDVGIVDRKRHARAIARRGAQREAAGISQIEVIVA